MTGYDVTMVLRCSLLGHDFGDTEVEHEREERGSEVVVTVLEFEQCDRCGLKNVLSEKSEVTSLAAESKDAGADIHADDEGAGGDGLAAAEGTAPAEVDSAPTIDTTDADTESDGITADLEATARADDAEILVDESDGTDKTASESASASSPPDERVETVDSDASAESVDTIEASSAGTDGDSVVGSRDGDADVGHDSRGAEIVDAGGDVREPTKTEADADADTDTEGPVEASEPPVTDDGEIIEADDGQVREHGEWPDSTDVGPPIERGAEPASWPEARTGVADETDSQAVTEPSSTDEGAILVDPDSERDTEAGTGAPDSTASERPETGFESADEAPAPHERAPLDGVQTEFFCPHCRFVAPGDRGSLRSGDICPECRRGYLGERAR